MYKNLKIFSFSFVLSVLFINTVFAQKCKEYDITEEVSKRYECVWNADKQKWLLAKECKGKNAGKYKRAKKKGLSGKRLKNHKKGKKSCKHLASPGELGLRSLPSLSELLSGGIETSSFAESRTPPTFTEIAEGEGGISSKTIFWRDFDGANIVDAINGGSPTANQCSEFWAGSTEGSSGGFGACQGVAGAARALAKPLEAGGITMCYLQNAPSPKNFLGKGIRKVSGKLPGGKITNLFLAPEGSENRIVEVRVRGEDNSEEEGSKNTNIFITVHSDGNNASNGNNYKAELVFCDLDGNTPFAKETITISDSNIFTGSSYSNYSGSDEVQVNFQAGIAESDDGEFEFDASVPKEAQIKFVANLDDGDLKIANNVYIENGIITVKSFESIGGESRKDYSKTEFSGEGLDELRVFNGATKQIIDNIGDDYTFNTAFEYSDSYYSTALSSELGNQVAAYNISGDLFYSTDPTIDDDTSNLGCNFEADIVVVMDMSKKTMKEVSKECESIVPRNSDICGTDDIRSAEEAWFSACNELS